MRTIRYGWWAWHNGSILSQAHAHGRNNSCVPVVGPTNGWTEKELTMRQMCSMTVNKTSLFVYVVRSMFQCSPFFSRWNFFSIVSVCRVGRHYVSRWPLLLVFLLLILDCLREIGNDRVDALRQANEWKKQDGKAEKHDEKRRNEVKPVRQHMLLPLPLPCGIKVKIVKENTNTVDGNGRIFRIK